jgi:hypothetical protein
VEALAKAETLEDLLARHREAEAIDSLNYTI